MKKKPENISEGPESTPEKRFAIIERCQTRQEAMNKYIHRWVHGKILRGKEFAIIAKLVKEKFS